MIPKKTDPKRVVSFCKDEALVPTLYSDDKLIYKTSMTMPSFVWERFYDNGYSFGMFGMQMAASGNAEFILGTSKTNHQSTAYEKLSVMELGESSIFVDKVNGQKISEEYLSNGGSVSGLKKNEKYEVDLYIGTKYHNIPMVADTLILNSMNVFQTTEFDLYQDGYASITIPENLESGYYMINGLGVFRYVNGPRSSGYDEIDFNYVNVEENKKK